MRHSRSVLNNFSVIAAELSDLAIVSFELAPERLKPLLPAGFTPEIFTDDTRKQHALVSAVSFRVRNFRHPWLPLVQFSGVQINYRAYIRCRGERSIWFFETASSARWAAFARWLWRLPWYHRTIEIESRWDEGRCLAYRLGGADGSASLSLQPVPPGAALPLAAFDTTAVTESLVGFCWRTDGKISRFRVEHLPLEVSHMSAGESRYDLFTRLGLVDPGAQPHSVLLSRSAVFRILMPPRVVRDPP